MGDRGLLGRALDLQRLTLDRGDEAGDPGHAAEALAVWIRDHVDRPLLVGPDEESRQWIVDVAAHAQAPYVVLSKVRHDDGTVEVTAPDLWEHREQTPVVVDDIVSSARTMLATVKALAAALETSPFLAV